MCSYTRQLHDIHMTVTVSKTKSNCESIFFCRIITHNRIKFLKQIEMLKFLLKSSIHSKYNRAKFSIV